MNQINHKKIFFKTINTKVMSNSKEQMFSEQDFKNFLYSEGSESYKVKLVMEWENYKKTHPPVIEPIVEEKVDVATTTTERDYSGVRFTWNNCNNILTIKKDECGNYSWGTGNGYYNPTYIESMFKNGAWIEVKEETPIKDVENKIDSMSNGVHKETRKLFEQSPKKDYEILSFTHSDTLEILTRAKYGRFSNAFNSFLQEEKVCLERGYKIYSVKRLSDGEVFTIGDIVDECVSTNDEYKWEISEFSLKDNRCFSLGINIDYLKKLPKEQSHLVHSELPKITTEIELLANRISELERKTERNSLDIGHLNRLLGESLMQPTKKNLNLDGDDWADYPCLSYREIMRWLSDNFNNIIRVGAFDIDPLIKVVKSKING